MSTMSPKDFAKFAKKRPVAPVRPQKRRTTTSVVKGFRKPVAGCEHVLAGAPWCNVCGTEYLRHCRTAYDASLRSHAPAEVISAARERLANALIEYSITEAGIADLERQYATALHRKLSVDAQRLNSAVRNAKAKRSERIQNARKADNTLKARTSTVESLLGQYSKPTVGADGKKTTKGYTLFLGRHAEERQLERKISTNEINEAFNGNNVILPRGHGVWSVEGSNGVRLVGSFDRLREKQQFYVITLYRAGQNDERDEYIILLDQIEHGEM